MIASGLAFVALLAAGVPEVQVTRVGVIEAGAVRSDTMALHPGETVVYALDWRGVTRPAQPRLAFSDSGGSGDPAADAAQHQWVRFVPNDPRAAGADSLELLLVALGKSPTPAAELQDEQGATIAQVAPLELETVAAIAEEEAEPAPLRDPSSLDLDMAGLLIVLTAAALLGALLLALAVYLVWRWRRRRSQALAPAPPLPPIAADQRALQALDALLAEGWLERGELKRFAVSLAEIGKGFIGELSGVPLLELTTDECVRALRVSGLGGAHAPWLQSWLTDLDMVKFAEAKPPADQLRDAAMALRRVVQAQSRHATPQGSGADTA